jgi:hypothetical protein
MKKKENQMDDMVFANEIKKLYEERTELLFESVDIAQEKLNAHCEKLEKFLESKVCGYLESMPAALDERAKRAAENVIKITTEEMENEIRKKYGWVDFDPDKTNDLIDDQNYLVRYQNMDGTWMCTHLAYWNAQEKQFSLLHSTTFMPPIVHQYLKIPE